VSEQIAVIMPVYNGELFVLEAIHSLQRQTDSRFHFYILDDGSTDNTWAQLHTVEDSRIRLLKNDTNLGLAKSLNRLIRETEEPILVRQDADDISFPARIAGIRAAFNNKGVQWVNSRVYIMSRFGVFLRPTLESQIDPRYYLQLLPYFNCYVHGAAAFRREAWEKGGGDDETLETAQDYDLWLRFHQMEIFTHFIPRSLYAVRRHPAMVSRLRFREQLFSRIRISNRFPGPSGILNHWFSLAEKHWNWGSFALSLGVEYVIKLTFRLRSQRMLSK